MSNPGENCSSGCLTRDHVTYGECMKSKRLGHMALGGTTSSHGERKAWASENAELRSVVQSGGSISTALTKGFDAAYSEATGG